MGQLYDMAPAHQIASRDSNIFFSVAKLYNLATEKKYIAPWDNIMTGPLEVIRLHHGIWL